MTFQRAHRAARSRGLLRALSPAARDRGRRLRSEPGAATPTKRATAIDFIVRGEGEQTLRELLRALESGGELSDDRRAVVPHAPTASSATPIGPVARARVESRCGCPTARARVLRGYTLLGRPVDVVETSRGCTFDCSFCSIIEMRGRNFHPYPIERVLADIADARAPRRASDLPRRRQHHARRRAASRRCARRSSTAGFNDIDYIVQAMTSPIAQHGARLAPLMRRAGFRYVFLGIENVLDGRSGVPARRGARTRTAKAAGRSATPRIAAIEHLHRQRHVRRRRPDRRQPRRHARARSTPTSTSRARYVDWPYIQHPDALPAARR